MVAVIETLSQVYEANLGRLRDRWHVSENLHVLRFEAEPPEDLTTYVTLGLSRLSLHQDSDQIRQELLFACHRRFASDDWVSLLGNMAGRAAIEERAIAAFEVVPLDPLLRQQSRFDAYWASRRSTTLKQFTSLGRLSRRLSSYGSSHCWSRRPT
jgi:hypothetical protein